jgi:hypothetical protein
MSDWPAVEPSAYNIETEKILQFFSLTFEALSSAIEQIDSDAELWGGRVWHQARESVFLVMEPSQKKALALKTHTLAKLRCVRVRKHQLTSWCK